MGTDTTADADTIGTRIFHGREKRGWSQGELGRRAGTTQAQISKYETGMATPTVRVLRRIADAFGSTIDDLCPPET